MARYHLQSQDSARLDEIIALLGQDYVVSHICRQDWPGCIRILPSYWVWFSTNAPYKEVKLAIDQATQIAKIVWVKPCPFVD